MTERKAAGMMAGILMSSPCRSAAAAENASPVFCSFLGSLGRDMSWLPGPTSLHHNGLLSPPQSPQSSYGEHHES